MISSILTEITRATLSSIYTNKSWTVTPLFRFNFNDLVRHCQVAFVRCISKLSPHLLRISKHRSPINLLKIQYKVIVFMNRIL